MHTRWMRGRTALIAVAACAAVAPAVAPTPASAQSGCSLTSTNGTVTGTLDGHGYRLNVPAGLIGPSVPLLVSLHGNYEPNSIHETSTGWTPYAAVHNFIVVYPQGTGSGVQWDFNQGSADVTFLKHLVADLSSRYCIDPKRVHAEGYSNGAIMVERLACDAADVFASVAEYAGSSPAITGSPCSPSRPIAVGLFQGILDPVSSYPIGVQNRDEWVARNGCPSTATTESGVLVEASRYAPCAGGVEVDWRVYLQSHNWPIGNDATDIRDRMWGLFQRNPKP